MITAPTGWDDIWSDPNSKLEVYISVLAGTSGYSYSMTFNNDQIAACNVSAALYNDLSIGNACSRRLTFTLLDQAEKFADFTRYQGVYLGCRYRLGDTVTPYAQIGRFFIDSVQLVNGRNIEVTAYDHLYFMEDAAGKELASGNVYDFNTAYTTGYGSDHVPIQASYTALMNTPAYGRYVQTNINAAKDDCLVKNIAIPAEVIKNTNKRELMANVAALAGGNIVIDSQNVLKLFKLTGEPTITDSAKGQIITAANAEYDHALSYITGVMVGDYVSNSGWLTPVNLSSDYPMTQNKAHSIMQNMLNAYYLTGSIRESIKATNIVVNGAFMNPLLELGDLVSIPLGGGKYLNFTLANYDVNFVGACWGSVGSSKSDNAIQFYIDENETWTDVKIGSSYSTVDYVTPDVFIDGVKTLSLRNVVINRNKSNDTASIARLSGFTPLRGRVRYWTAAGTQITKTVTAHRITEYCPVLRNVGADTYIPEIKYIITDEFAASAVGTDAENLSLTLKDTDSSYEDGTAGTIRWA